MDREPICTCVSPYREPARAARHVLLRAMGPARISLSPPARLHIVYIVCADKLYGFHTNGLAGSDVSSAEIGRVQVLTRFRATTRDPASRERAPPSLFHTNMHIHTGIYVIYL